MSILRNKIFVIVISAVLAVGIACGVGIPLLSQKISNDNYNALCQKLDTAFQAYYDDAEDEKIDTQSAYAHIEGLFDEDDGVFANGLLYKGNVILQENVDNNKVAYQYKNGKWITLNNFDYNASSSYNYTAKYSPKTTKPGMPNVPEYTYLVYAGYRVYSAS